MGEWTFEQKQIGLIFAHRLERLGRKAPDVEVQQKINALVHTIRLLYGMSQEEKAEVVFTLIKDGAMTVEDLEWETGFPRQKIWPIIATLKSENKVEIRKIPSGRQGPPYQVIKPIENGRR